MSDTLAGLSVSDQADVRALPQRIVDAWAGNDADAFADTFTPDATMILPGDVFLHGRTAIRDYMAHAYAGPLKNTRVTGTPLALSFIAADVAVVITEGGVLEPGQTVVAPEREIRATWVAAKQDDHWLLSAYHNSPVNLA
jgi:uncharacterized protein (TIGR02246 family)